MPSGIGLYEIVDGKLLLLYLNDAFHRMLQDTRENRRQYTGEHYLKAVHPDDIPAFQSMVETILQGAQTAELTCRVKNGKGNWVWLRLNGNLKPDLEGRSIFYCSFFDVDEQTKMQLALNREQAMLKQAMQTAKMSSWEYDVSQKSMRQAEMFPSQRGSGLTATNVPDSLIASGLIHPDSIRDCRRLFLPPADANDIKSADLYLRMPDGHTYGWERVFLSPVFDANGVHVRSIGTTIDVTDQKNAERKYLRQLQELSSADSPDLIAKGLYNLTKGINESYTAHTENAVPAQSIVTYDDGLQETGKLFFKASEAEKFLRLFDRRQLLRNFSKGDAELAMEYQRKTQSGTVFWARTQCKLAASPHGEDVLCFLYSYDIHEYKMAQETIRAVIGQDYDYLAVLDCRANSYVTYSDGTDEQAAFPSRRSTDYERSVREYAAAFLPQEELSRSLQSMTLQNIQAQLRQQDSFTNYINVKIPPHEMLRKKLQYSYLDRDNEQVLITCMDITEIYVQEQKRLTELRDAAQAVERANSIKTDFLARMSHDLRTPMNAVIGLTELAQDELTNPQAMKYYLSNINSAGKFLLGLVNDCLDFEKISQGRMRLCPAPYPYAAFRQSISTLIEPLCRAKNITFVVTADKPEITVQADAIRMEQIFINLLTNAVKFTPEGGKVEFLIQNTVCRDGLLSCDFIVRDNGIGMSLEFQGRMFEPFEQEVGCASPQPQSTGLGLAIVQKLVELMNGTIAVQSELGHGTEFTVRLTMPLASSEEQKESASAAISDTQLEGFRVLLVEDHPLNAEIARRLLEKKGVLITCAGNGKEALELFVQAAPYAWDAILMDVRMPVMDGLTATRAIRALERKDAKAIPIIAMTANAFEEDVQATKSAGMNDHLAKPIEPQRLYDVLSHCSHHTSHSENG